MKNAVAAPLQRSRSFGDIIHSSPRDMGTPSLDFIRAGHISQNATAGQSVDPRFVISQLLRGAHSNHNRPPELLAPPAPARAADLVVSPSSVFMNHGFVIGLLSASHVFGAYLILSEETQSDATYYHGFHYGWQQSALDGLVGSTILTAGCMLAVLLGAPRAEAGRFTRRRMADSLQLSILVGGLASGTLGHKLLTGESNVYADQSSMTSAEKPMSYSKHCLVGLPMLGTILISVGLGTTAMLGYAAYQIVFSLAVSAWTYTNPRVALLNAEQLQQRSDRFETLEGGLSESAASHFPQLFSAGQLDNLYPASHRPLPEAVGETAIEVFPPQFGDDLKTDAAIVLGKGAAWMVGNALLWGTAHMLGALALLDNVDYPAGEAFADGVTGGLILGAATLGLELVCAAPNLLAIARDRANIAHVSREARIVLGAVLLGGYVAALVDAGELGHLINSGNRTVTGTCSSSYLPGHEYECQKSLRGIPALFGIVLVLFSLAAAAPAYAHEADRLARRQNP